MFLMRPYIPIATLFLLWGNVYGQQTPPEDVVTFKTGASLVRVDVQVLDKGRPLDGLQKSDFVVTDEGSPQSILAFGQESEPLEILFVLDVSGSMGKLLGSMASVAEKALQSLSPSDEVGVELFSRRSTIALEMTPERSLALRALREAPLERELGAGTSLNEALQTATDYLKTRETAARRALIVLTDNGGLNKNLPDQQILRALSSVNAILNAIVPKNAKPPAPPPPGVEINDEYSHSNVFLLAEQSGGDVVKAETPEKLHEILERMRMRYSLGYRTPQGTPGSFRKIQVELTPAARKAHPKAELRARAGYYVP